MRELFKTVFYLSLIGAGATALLTLLKPFTVKHLTSRWQYYIWLSVTVCMLVPFWRFIPQRQAQQFTERFQPSVQMRQAGTQPAEQDPLYTDFEPTPAPHSETVNLIENGLSIYDLIAYVWLAGMGIFLTLAAGSYAVFLLKKRKNSIALENNSLFDEVKRELKIKRKIRIRISRDSDSPMLVGTLFPIIYLPIKAADENAVKMIFRHELTHYKHGDLLYKQLTLFVNAVHWFNPFAYLLSANVNQSCEVACDMAVIKNMSDSDRQCYMETILDMVEREQKNV
ncbi:MAG: hypothetical protein J6N52_09615 [Clostridia bacterium]|nr:hypothetical protein [Clostridia bacterium]